MKKLSKCVFYSCFRTWIIIYLNRSERVLAEGKDSVSAPERQRSITISHMPVLSKPPTTRTRREDSTPAPSTTVSRLSTPPSTIVEDESESEIEVEKVASRAKSPVIEDDEPITPPPENYDSALVIEQGMLLILY